MAAPRPKRRCVRPAGSYLDMIRGRNQQQEPDSESDIDPEDLVGSDNDSESESSDAEPTSDDGVSDNGGDADSNDMDTDSSSSDEEADDGWVGVKPGEAELPRRPFTVAQTGPQHIPDEMDGACDYFELLVTDELLTSWIEETERYAAQYMATRRLLQQYSRCHDWDWPELLLEDKLCEMRALLALSLLMGIVEKPALEDYWNQAQWSMFMPAFGDVMPLKRYQLLLRFFHIRDNDLCPPRDDDDFDPLYKVGAFADYLNEKFIHYYTPGREVAVDESLIGYKGHHATIQFMPNKHHHQWGPKMWVAAESETGYTFKFDIYRGKKYTPTSDHGITHDVVVKLMAPLNGKGYHCFTDNFYTSPQLCQTMLDDNTDLTGTVRANRTGMPQAFKTKFPKDQLRYFRKGQMLAAKWHDRKEVRLLSTVSRANNNTVVHHRTKKQKLIPEVVESYNQGMGGVDRADQMIDNYSGERRTVKLWKKMVFHLLDRTLLNAYILYKAHFQAEKHLSHKNFILSVLEAWLIVQKCRNMNRRKLCRGSSMEAARIAAANPTTPRIDPTSWHYIMPIPRREHIKDVQRHCVYCRERGLRRRSSYECPYCPDRPALCIGDCFRGFHLNRMAAAAAAPHVQDGPAPNAAAAAQPAEP